MAVSADDHNIWDQISIIPISRFHNFIKIANLFFDQNISRVIRFIERKSKKFVKQ